MIVDIFFTSYYSNYQRILECGGANFLIIVSYIMSFYQNTFQIESEKKRCITVQHSSQTLGTYTIVYCKISFF